MHWVFGSNDGKIRSLREAISFSFFLLIKKKHRTTARNRCDFQHNYFRLGSRKKSDFPRSGTRARICALLLPCHRKSDYL